jgi:hypothetical protein
MKFHEAALCLKSKMRLHWRRSFRGLLLALSAVTTTCTPFKDDPFADSGAMDANAASLSDSRTPGAFASAGDGRADAGTWPPCDLSKPFGPPTFVQGLTNIGSPVVEGLRLSPDLLTGYFDARGPTSNGVLSRLYIANRATPDAPFGDVAPIGGSVSNALLNVASPTVSGDGLTIMFDMHGQTAHLYYGTRSRTSDPFAYAGALSVNDPAGNDWSPFLREDGNVLYFGSTRNAGNSEDIYRAEWSGSSFGPVVPIAELNTTFIESSPIVTPDDLTIYFGSSRPPASGHGRDIWMANRASTSDPFSAPTNVGELNSPDLKDPTYVARGGCTLYFSTNNFSATRETGAQYVAEKPAR